MAASLCRPLRAEAPRRLISRACALGHEAAAPVGLGCVASLALLMALVGGGCIGDPANPAATQPATQISRDTVNPAYWYEQPAVASAGGRDFDRLWEAAHDAAVSAGFAIDRKDYRLGVLTTHPLISKSAWELWRGDVADGHSLTQSTLATMRRTVRFEFVEEDGAFRVSPKVLVERYSMVEHRVTSAAEYREVFALTRAELTRDLDRQRNPMLAREGIPPVYWIPVDRDDAMEKRLAEQIGDRIAAEPG